MIHEIYMKNTGHDKYVNSQRCFYTEHGSKPDTANPTFYFQIIRIFYAKGSSEIALNPSEAIQITKMTFAPVSLPFSTDENVMKYESFSKTVERVSSWLANSGIKILKCFEG